MPCEGTGNGNYEHIQFSSVSSAARCGGFEFLTVETMDNDAVQCVRNVVMFRRELLPPFAGSKCIKLNLQLHTCLLISHENGGDVIL
jgi:hypothetical protein